MPLSYASNIDTFDEYKMLLTKRKTIINAIANSQRTYSQELVTLAQDLLFVKERLEVYKTS